MKDRVGEEYITNEGYKVRIVEYFGKDNCTIKFNCGNKLLKITYDNIIKGRVRNPFVPIVSGVGFTGKGVYKASIDGKRTKCYLLWKNVLRRVYDREYKSYDNVTVCEEWHNFQNFAEWFYNKSNYKEEWQLDKDILSTKDRIYSPKTCSFIPQEINKLLIKSNIFDKIKTDKSYLDDRGTYRASLNIGGKSVHLKRCSTQEEAMQTYKIAKEKHIKEIANKYKNVLEQKVFEALITYKI